MSDDFLPPMPPQLIRQFAYVAIEDPEIISLPIMQEIENLPSEDENFLPSIVISEKFSSQE